MALGLLVGRFGTFVREAHSAGGGDAPVAPAAFPGPLNHVRDAVSHHLIPLLLLARSDNDFSPQERDVIVAHCVALARGTGVEIGDALTVDFSDYVGTFRPTLMQLDPALSRLEKAPHAEVGALLAAARAVIDADGVVRPEETRFLAELSEELDAFKTAS
jgi:hypothetical protein